MDIKIKARIYALIVTIIIVFGVVLLVNGYIKFKKNRFDSNQTKMYRDIDCIIIGTNEETGVDINKFTRPAIEYRFLIRMVKDTTKYMHMYSSASGIHNISDTLWYKKGIGDTIHFDYIKRITFSH